MGKTRVITSQGGQKQNSTRSEEITHPKNQFARESLDVEPEFYARPKDKKKKPNVPQEIPSTVVKCAEFKETEFKERETEAKKEQ